MASFSGSTTAENLIEGRIGFCSEVSTCPGRFSQSSNCMSSPGSGLLVPGDAAAGTTLIRTSCDARAVVDLSWSPKALPWAGTEGVAFFKDTPRPRPLQDEIRRQDKSTSQLLQIIKKQWLKRYREDRKDEGDGGGSKIQRSCS